MSECLLYPPSRPIDPTIRAAFGSLTTALISDQMDRSGGLAGVHPIPELAGRVVVGRALTVKARPGDNLIVHKAADLAQPGDFMVIDAGGVDDRAIIGEIWCRYAASRGLVAVALDGAVRDAHALRSLDMPVFARAITHQGPFKVGSGEIRGAIAIANTVIRPGDYVIGDADGVVVVPAERASEVLAAAQQRLATEHRMLRSIADGTLDRSWLDSLVVIDAPSAPTPAAR